MGPDSLIVAARVAFNDDLGSDKGEDLADAIDRALSEGLPLRARVFIDPTQARQTPPPRAARSRQARCQARVAARARSNREPRSPVWLPDHPNIF